MAGEKILVLIHDSQIADPTSVLVSWALTSPIVGPDGVSYQSGADPISVSLSDSDQAIISKLRSGIAARVSEVTGQAFIAADVRGFKAVRTGSVSITVLETFKDVTFSLAMPSTNYKVIPLARGTTWGMDITNITVNGFRFTFTAGLVATVDFIVVED